MMGPYQSVLAILVCCAVMAVSPGARADDPCADGLLSSASVNGRILYMRWNGTVRFNMEGRINDEFERVKNEVDIVVLSLSSCGGESYVVYRTVEVLRRIKATHLLVTHVDRGAMCNSACIPIFLQGHKRMAALASIWVIHQTYRQETTDDTVALRRDEKHTELSFKAYYVPAGVSKRWLRRVRSKIKTGNYWQTGHDLWESKSGIITVPIENLQRHDKDWRMYLAPTVVCGDFCRG